MKQLTIPFRETHVRVPLVDISVGEKDNLCAIVDTGSETTLFDNSFLENYQIHSNKMGNMDLVSIHGDESTEIKLVDTNLLFGKEGQALRVKGISANLSGVNDYLKAEHDEIAPMGVILGSDFLKQYKAKINYKTKELTLFYDISSE